jgi:hypothetical protein
MAKHPKSHDASGDAANYSDTQMKPRTLKPIMNRLIACLLLALTTACRHAAKIEAVPLTAEELANELGIANHRCKCTFDEPVLAKIWIVFNEDGKPREVSLCAIKTPSGHVTYQVLLKPKPSVHRGEATEITIGIKGDRDNSEASSLFFTSKVMSASWGFMGDNVTSLDQDIVIYRNEQEIVTDAKTTKRIIEVKVRFWKP